jgi:hypothetical protein
MRHGASTCTSSPGREADEMRGQGGCSFLVTNHTDGESDSRRARYKDEQRSLTAHRAPAVRVAQAVGGRCARSRADVAWRACLGSAAVLERALSLSARRAARPVHVSVGVRSGAQPDGVRAAGARPGDPSMWRRRGGARRCCSRSLRSTSSCSGAGRCGDVRWRASVPRRRGWWRTCSARRWR